jgi:uncharacterized protein (TIGR02246 family)
VNSPTAPAHASGGDVLALYDYLLERWNERDAAGMAALFADDGNVVGFDGSQLDGRTAIESEMARIFKHHPTGRYVGIVREVRFLSEKIAVLRAVAGMVPPGKSELNPAVNAVQTLVAVNGDSGWSIALYQNTPAAFHGRPDAVEALTEELRKELHARTR